MFYIKYIAKFVASCYSLIQYMDAFIILGLILLNGAFALSEMALISMKKVRLETEAKKGDKRAERALQLAEKPDKFLSTIQIGITSIGILTGLFSGSSVAEWFTILLSKIPILEPYSYSISVTFIVVLVTFLSLIFGELVPKRIALNNPEIMAKWAAGPMNAISWIATPFVWLLSTSTQGVMKLFGIDGKIPSKVTEEEIKALLQDGTNDGEIQIVEHDIVERVFNLGDRDVNSLMTHRNDLVWLDLEDSIDEIRKIITEHVHIVYPVAMEQIDEINGVVFLKDFFADFNQPDFNIRNYVKPAQFVPESMSAYNALDFFRRTQLFYAIVTDEFGSVQGIITINDLMEALLGTIVEPDEHDEQILEREDGTWLVDGQYSFYDFLAYFDMEEFYPEHDFNTLSGLILDILEHIPVETEKLQWQNFEMEIMDMDAARIDKVLVRKLETPTES